MSKLIDGSKLNSEIIDLFNNAEKELIIISPYIKLHSRIKDSLKLRKDDDLFLTVVYGKNPENKQKSLSKEDMEFFKGFRDVEIRYEERLHAKVFANDDTSILTSMNLYDFSMNNNIEFGIVNHKKSSIEKLKNIFSENLSMDDQVTMFIYGIIENSELIFNKSANYEKKFLSTKYVESIIEVDKTIQNKKNINKNIGYCIRTGKEIPFNPKKPFSSDAFKSWAKYKKPDFKEKYCHKTGKKSFGKTSFNNPIL